MIAIHRSDEPTTRSSEGSARSGKCLRNCREIFSVARPCPFRSPCRHVGMDGCHWSGRRGRLRGRRGRRRLGAERPLLAALHPAAQPQASRAARPARPVRRARRSWSSRSSSRGRSRRRRTRGRTPPRRRCAGARPGGAAAPAGRRRRCGRPPEDGETEEGHCHRAGHHQEDVGILEQQTLVDGGVVPESARGQQEPEHAGRPRGPTTGRRGSQRAAGQGVQRQGHHDRDREEGRRHGEAVRRAGRAAGHAVARGAATRPSGAVPERDRRPAAAPAPGRPEAAGRTAGRTRARHRRPQERRRPASRPPWRAGTAPPGSGRQPSTGAMVASHAPETPSRALISPYRARPRRARRRGRSTHHGSCAPTQARALRRPCRAATSRRPR